MYLFSFYQHTVIARLRSSRGDLMRLLRYLPAGRQALAMTIHWEILNT
ncbi:MAG: hypothetical protein HY428_01605, partial [Candidatus Levybacteria bacterium]|nr:hypothetical protein [Candidatus Levybacteria bacterium]